MKLQDLLEFEIPLTVTSLRAWPSPTKGEQHSGQMTVKVDPDKGKVNLPNRKKRRVFFDKSLKSQTSGGTVKEGKVSKYKMYDNHDGTWYVENENEEVVLRNASKSEAQHAVDVGNEKLQRLGV